MKIILIFTILFETSLCINVAYVHTNITDFQCFKDKLYSAAFIRGYLSTGRIDPYLITNLKAASKLNLKPSVYMNPCLKCMMLLTEQVKMLLNAIKDMKCEAVIFKVKLSDNWLNNPASNCKNIKLALNVISNGKRLPVIQSDINDWDRIMGKDCKVKTFYAQYLVWDKHDKQKSFKDFKPFAGFDMANFKEYDGPLQICNHEVDVAASYYNSADRLFE